MASLMIGKTEYDLALVAGPPNRTIRLSKRDGAVYDVTEGERTTCDCADWIYRHADLPYSDGCKHIRALASAGFLRSAPRRATA
jgi:hypothetical protein